MPEQTPVRNIELNSGKLPYGNEVNKDILLEANKATFLGKLGVQEPVDLSQGGQLTFHDYVGFEVVEEGRAKNPTPFQTKTSSIQRAMVQGNSRASTIAMRKAADNGVEIIKKTHAVIGQSFGGGTEIVLVNGTSPNDGLATSLTSASLVNNTAVEKIEVSQTGRVDLAIIEAFASRLESDQFANGLVVTPLVWSKLSALTDTQGRKLYPQFSLGNFEDVYFEGVKVVVSQYLNRLDYRGTLRNSNAFVLGDWTKFRWGLELLEAELITTGDPDGRGDLKRHNEVNVRQEAIIQSLVAEYQSFALGQWRA